ncbi:DUF1614 domain-containing protein [Arhodomonas sp. SL1]|uniref:DUF1614 domain-containing protein n=1 Tax=Arhodomonas sp. SL1 TaxID=3425691 RepID=UPI003F880657
MNPLGLLLGVFLLAFVFALVQVGALTIAFDKLGLSSGSAMLLLLSSLAGSGINLPLFTLDAEGELDPRWRQRQLWMNPLMRQIRAGKVLVAMNVGGGLVPVFFSGYLLSRSALPLTAVVLATALQSLVCYLFSRPIRGVGIGMPIFIAPISAALIAVTVLPEASAPLAYICGTMGVLIGADLMRLRDVGRLGAPLASIGGAGTFDGVFITGIVAVLLA